MPLSESFKWEELTTRDRAKVARLTAEVHRAESKIDTLAQDLFETAPDEAALPEDSIKCAK